MLGKPKYKVGDKVRFTVDGNSKLGEVEIVDAYGTWGDDSDVSYDIFVKEDNTLYKHFNEKYVDEAG